MFSPLDYYYCYYFIELYYEKTKNDFVKNGYSIIIFTRSMFRNCLLVIFLLILIIDFYN